ncbi:MAG: tetratricopeptide repeat protein [Pyrinomonadaceae bacterium]|nr:tetratricopeptide repeat protein [Pyrinomonadaceae bacterium]
MADIASSNRAEISASSENVSELINESVSVRVSPNSYLAGSFLATFFSGLLVYLHHDLAALIVFLSGWIVIPLAFWRDRIVFDGQRLIRTGPLPAIWSKINRSEHVLDLDDVEQVETQALRALKRGGSVFYRYRTTIAGGSVNMVVASGGESYRRMVKSLLPCLNESLLDNRSIELRDYMSEPKETLLKAEFAKVPSTEVLEQTIQDFETLRNEKKSKPDFGDEDIEKADYLRTLANELRLSGYLLQALEVFRRALFLNPRDGWLLFEFARCLHSFAGAEKNSRIEKRALAVMRLAEKRAGNDTSLLERLGESYFQYGDWERASLVFKRTIAKAETSFRSLRGMAEISLREGKIAHVIHHFSSANRIAEIPSLRRWTQAETDYFSKLNDDEDYLDMEVSRVNLLDSLERAKRTALRISLLGLPAILIGVVGDVSLVSNIGWAVSATSLVIWTGIIISRNILSERIPVDATE